MRCSALLLIVLACSPGPSDAVAEHPNVVFVLTDDLGWGDLASFGHPLIRTPNLDRLAEEGTSFEQFYVASPSCSPSRTAFVTGHYPGRHGVHRIFSPSPRKNRERGMPNWLDPDVTTVADLLRDAGYATAHFGKWHLTGEGFEGAPAPSEYGFDESTVLHSSEWDEERPEDWRARSTGLLVEEALRFAEENRGRPFFVQLWTLVPHAHLKPTAEELARYEDLDVDPELFEGTMRTYLEGAEDARTQMKVFAAAVTGLDDALGRLFRGLDELGLTEETIVFFTSDNGPEDYHVAHAANAGVGSTGPFRARKRSLYEGGLRAPCIVRWPARVPAGRVDETSVVSGVDFLPTVCALAGVEPPAGLDGEDVSDVLLGSPRPRRGPLFWEWRAGVAGDQSYLSPGVAIRDGSYKLHVNPEGGDVELYDVVGDPGETEDLAEREPERTAELVERALAWHHTLP